MKVGKRVRQLADAAGVGPTRGYDTIVDWQNEHGGGVVVMSANQSKLGYDCHQLIYDDPLDEYGADSPQVRDSVDHTISHYQARCVREGKPGPVLGVMSRWHPDDPFGRRLSRAAPFEYVHRRALEDEGLDTERSAFPDIWPLPVLLKTRAELAEADPTERIWWAQFQNEPIVTGGDLFHEPTRYTEMPTWAYRQAYGTDFAFSEGKKADFFVIMAGRVYGERVYIQEVKRDRISTPIIESHSKAMVRKYGRAPIFTYQSGPEIGTAHLLVERGLPIVSMHARYSKLVRAERTIARWNAGKVLVPEDGAGLWVPGFLIRVAKFRGWETDDGDDEIDAMVSMCDGAVGATGSVPRAFGRARV